jgi:hypothetical protein
MASMWLLLMVLAVTALMILAWASGVALRFARGARKRPGRRR